MRLAPALDALTPRRAAQLRRQTSKSQMAVIKRQARVSPLRKNGRFASALWVRVVRANSCGGLGHAIRGASAIGAEQSRVLLLALRAMMAAALVADLRGDDGQTAAPRGRAD
jgi:hypothetical protein